MFKLIELLFLACRLKKASSGCGFCWGQFFPYHWPLVWTQPWQNIYFLAQLAKLLIILKFKLIVKIFWNFWIFLNFFEFFFEILNFFEFFLNFLECLKFLEIFSRPLASWVTIRFLFTLRLNPTTTTTQTLPNHPNPALPSIN